MKVVTDVTRQAKDSGRVNIFLDGAYGFSLSLDAVLQHKLARGTTLTDEQVEKIRATHEEEIIYSKSLNFLSFRPRSRKEIEERIHRYAKDLSIETQQTISSRVIHKLAKLDLIDDQKFADWFVQNRKRHRPRSKLQILQELLQKGVSKEDALRALEAASYSELEEIQKVIAKKLGRKSPKDLKTYLARKGFPFSLIEEALRKLPKSA